MHKDQTSESNVSPIFSYLFPFSKGRSTYGIVRLGSNPRSPVDVEKKEADGILQLTVRLKIFI